MKDEFKIVFGEGGTMTVHNVVMKLFACILAVYKEVERRIANFRDMLHKRLLDPNNTLDEQKKLIR